MCGSASNQANTARELLRCLTWRCLCVKHARPERAPFAGNFPKSVCTSVNECVCHGIPDARKLADGDIVNIDVTVYLNVRLPIVLQHCLLCRCFV